MAEQERRCGTCRWYGGADNYSPDLGNNVGECKYPRELVAMPISFSDERFETTETDGAHCPCWAVVT